MRLTVRALLLTVGALVAPAVGVLTSAPAQAAACPDADGVTVVVDHHELGGGLQQVCDTGGAGKSAATQFTESGFTLTRVQRQPGFVCRVNGAPSEDQESCVNTPPADAYWGLWWSDGTSGTWKYATEGVDSLTVPEGGYVALSWNGSSQKSPPGAAPTAHPSESPSPSAQPSRQPSKHPTAHASGTTSGSAPAGSPTAGTSAASPSASGSASPSRSGSAKPSHRQRQAGHASDKRSHHSKKHPDASATPTPEESVSPSPAAATSEPPSTGDGGLPVWVAPAALGLLAAAAAGTAVVRRRRGTPGP